MCQDNMEKQRLSSIQFNFSRPNPVTYFVICVKILNLEDMWIFENWSWQYLMEKLVKHVSVA